MVHSLGIQYESLPIPHLCSLVNVENGIEIASRQQDFPGVSHLGGLLPHRVRGCSDVQDFSDSQDRRRTETDSLPYDGFGNLPSWVLDNWIDTTRRSFPTKIRTQFSNFCFYSTLDCGHRVRTSDQLQFFATSCYKREEVLSLIQRSITERGERCQNAMSFPKYVDHSRHRAKVHMGSPRFDTFARNRGLAA